MLVQPESLAQESPSTRPDDGFAQFPTGDDAEAGLGAFRLGKPVRNQTAFGQPASVIPDLRKLSARPQAHGALKLEAMRDSARRHGDRFLNGG